jgi:ATP-dependent Clp protease ATP-binding subunit ClpX
MDGVDLEFTKEAIEKVADLAIERNTGARGLRSIMEAVMLDIMYEIPAMEGLTKVIITKELVEGTGKAEYVFAPAA